VSVAEMLDEAGYWELVSGDLADEAWRASRDGAALHELVRDHNAGARARLLAAELLFRHGQRPDGISDEGLAEIYVDGLRAGVFAQFANPLGIPSGSLGPVGRRIVSLGQAAVAPLREALDDDGELTFAGSREATIGNSFGWRVKDSAAWLLAAIAGEDFEPDPDPRRREEEP
jgi:hypothetical protein